MFTDKSSTVAFTGHRTYDSRADEALKSTLASLYERGIRIFISGMAVGFDLTAAEAVLQLRTMHSDVQLVCAVPFVGQEGRFSTMDKSRYGAVLSQADRVEVICDHYHSGVYTQRNDMLVAHASCFVAWYDGSAGGTQYTLRRALRQRCEVINLYQRGLYWAEPTLF